jgi:hypothetical protein
MSSLWTQAEEVAARWCLLPGLHLLRLQDQVLQRMRREALPQVWRDVSWSIRRGLRAVAVSSLRTLTPSAHRAPNPQDHHGSRWTEVGARRADGRAAPARPRRIRHRRRNPRVPDPSAINFAFAIAFAFAFPSWGLHLVWRRQQWVRLFMRPVVRRGPHDAGRCRGLPVLFQ